MNSKNTVESGDYFTVPMAEGRQAVCQVIWIGKNNPGQKFKRVFAFCVLSVGSEKDIPEGVGYLSFQDYQGEFKVIFTAVDNLLSGEWPVIGNGPIRDQEMVDFEFNMAGTLYRSGEPVRVLAIEEYKDYLEMGISGYVLVERYLTQH